MPINKAASNDPSIRPSHVLCAYAVHDNLTRLVMPLCSAISGRVDPESPITKQLIIADISSLGLRQLWRLKDYVKNFSDLLALSYPEVLDRVLVSCSDSSNFAFITFALLPPRCQNLTLIESTRSLVHHRISRLHGIGSRVWSIQSP